MVLKSGTYAPADKSEKVEIWNPPTEGSAADGSATQNEINNSLPDGFMQEVDASNQSYYVLVSGKRDTPVRDLYGNAHVLVPGGAVVTKANGLRYTLTPDEFVAYEASHVSEGNELTADPVAPSAPPVVAEKDAQGRTLSDDGQWAWDGTEWVPAANAPATPPAS